MASHKAVVLKYLMDETPFTEKLSFVDRIQEINESHETVPEEVLESYGELTEYEVWELIRKVAVEGKRRTKNESF
ncbi:hypothetical protein [Paenibacillus polymyxa]|uniref:hypothetical protein n=1 Tax=Paenibacillus polymyxa TaxID=1406 RepID=UPI002AB5B138|nr:hypothetical protein [Paenibacillus polymyxa]MDY8021138.1 hypothetical protein [Paenibacillus polymyxa]